MFHFLIITNNGSLGFKNEYIKKIFKKNQNTTHRKN